MQEERSFNNEKPSYLQKLDDHQYFNEIEAQRAEYLGKRFANKYPHLYSNENSNKTDDISSLKNLLDLNDDELEKKINNTTASQIQDLAKNITESRLTENEKRELINKISSSLNKKTGTPFSGSKFESFLKGLPETYMKQTYKSYIIQKITGDTNYSDLYFGTNLLKNLKYPATYPIYGDKITFENDQTDLDKLQRFFSQLPEDELKLIGQQITINQTFREDMMKNKPYLFEIIKKEITKRRNSLIEQVKKMTPEQIKTLTEKEIKELKAYQIKELTPDQIKALTPKQIKALQLNQIKELTPDQIKELRFDQIKELTPDQLEALTPDQIEALKSNQVKKLTADDIKNFTEKEILSIPASAIENFSLEQMIALGNKYPYVDKLNPEIEDVLKKKFKEMGLKDLNELQEKTSEHGGWIYQLAWEETSFNREN